MAGMERFTQRARRVLSLAHQEAERSRNNNIGTEHLLLGLMDEEGGVAGRVLRELGMTSDRVREVIRRVTTSSSSFYPNRVELAADTQQVLEHAVEEARRLGHHYIGTEHILLGLIRVDSTAMEVLRRLGVTPEQIRRQTRRVLNESASSSSPTPAGSSSTRAGAAANPKTPLVDQLATDLTSKAEEKKLDPVIGRQMEIERVIQILARRTKNNPALIGEPGVGKTAIVEGLAQKMAKGYVPEALKDKVLVSLDLGSLVAGTKFRGEFEERLKGVIDEVKSSYGRIILFVDELHNLASAGAAEGSIDAGEILKPALARGEVQVIGATTIDEYRRHVEPDAALERRFQPILVEEPTEEETVEILRGIRDKYESHHGVEISEEALRAAASYSHRYVADRFLPDKAVDLLDEAASQLRIETTMLPDDLRELELKLQEITREGAAAVEEHDYERAAELRAEADLLQAEYREARERWLEESGVKDATVGREEIARVVSARTGIPVTRMLKDEAERLLSMEKSLHERVVGQDTAVVAVSEAVRKARAGLANPRRPIGSFIFLGPTGVGKTELARALAEYLFDDEDAMIRLDMSEYMERHTVSRLVGSPP